MLNFSHPHALWLLSTVAVPIVLHLLNRRRTRPLIFPSVRFLKNSRQPQEGRRHLRNLLLLALRMLIFILAVLWLAAPAWIPPQTAMHDSVVANSVILVDCSASMATGRRFQRARTVLEELLKQSNGSPVTLLASSDSVIKAIEQTRDTNAIMTAFDSLQPTYLAGNHLAALQQAAVFLQNHGDTLHIISDFQHSDWAHRRDIIPQNAAIHLHNIRQQDEHGNCAVTDVRCQRLGTRRLRALVTITNFSSLEQSRQLEVTIDNLTQTESITLAPYQSLKRAFLFDDVSLGTRCTAALSPDIYPLDDTRLFWGDGIPPLSVLMLTTAEASAAVTYTTIALTSNPAQDTSNEQHFTVTQNQQELFDTAALKHHQILFLLGNSHYLQTSETQAIREFLTQGGIVFVTAGKVPGADAKVLLECGIDLGQSGGLYGMSDSSHDSGFGDIAPESPLASLFSETEGCDLFTVSIRHYIRLQPSSSAIIHLKTLQGDPLLCEYPQGNGRLFYMALNFDEWWSDLQLSYSFLPMLHELLLTSAPSDYGRRRLTCGTPLNNDEGIPVDTSKPVIAMQGQEICEITIDSSESSEDVVHELDLLDLLGGKTVLSELPRTDSPAVPLQPLLEWLLLASVLLEIILAAYSVRQS